MMMITIIAFLSFIHSTKPVEQIADEFMIEFLKFKNSIYQTEQRR